MGRVSLPGGSEQATFITPSPSAEKGSAALAERIEPLPDAMTSPVFLPLPPRGPANDFVVSGVDTFRDSYESHSRTQIRKCWLFNKPVLSLQHICYTHRAPGRG